MPSSFASFWAVLNVVGTHMEAIQCALKLKWFFFSSFVIHFCRFRRGNGRRIVRIVRNINSEILPEGECGVRNQEIKLLMCGLH